MRSTHTILRSAGTSAVALFLIAGAAFATSTVVGSGRSPEAQPVSIDSESASPTDELETEDPTDELETEEATEEATDELETEDPSDELETEEPTASAEDEDEDATAEPTGTPEEEEASFDDHGGADDVDDDGSDDRSGSNSGSDHDATDDGDHSGSGSDDGATHDADDDHSGSGHDGDDDHSGSGSDDDDHSAALRRQWPRWRRRLRRVRRLTGRSIHPVPGPVTALPTWDWPDPRSWSRAPCRVPVADHPIKAVVRGMLATDRTWDAKRDADARPDDRRLVDTVLGGDRDAFRRSSSGRGLGRLGVCSRPRRPVRGRGRRPGGVRDRLPLPRDVARGGLAGRLDLADRRPPRRPAGRTAPPGGLARSDSLPMPMHPATSGSGRREPARTRSTRPRARCGRSATRSCAPRSPRWMSRIARSSRSGSSASAHSTRSPR